MATYSLGFLRKDLFIERLLIKKAFWAFILSFLFFFPIYRSINRKLPPELPKFGKVPSFELIDDFGKPFTSKSVQGKAYIASFLFTSCPTTCPKITEKLRVVQRRVKGVGTKLSILTFSVDPQNDTPEVLYKYARKQHANPTIWKFLTSQNEKEMKELLIKGFKVPVGEKELIKKKIAETEIHLWDIAHTEKFVLVDHEGEIRGYYGIDKAELNRLMIDVGLLVNREYWRNQHVHN